jgi:hypothetical protein
MRKRARANRWLVIIGAALAAHLVLFLFIGPSAVQFVRRVVSPGSDAPSGGNPPDAVLSIPIEYESGPAVEETVPVVTVDDQADQDAPTPPTDTPPSSPASGGTSELDGLIGDASRTIPRGTGSDPDFVRIPPRPLQITWPDTRRLKHCLGHQITVRVQVDETGRIVRIEAPGGDHPADCVTAALASAGQIVFAPGTIGGKPVKMWTEIRIDFRAKS